MQTPRTHLTIAVVVAIIHPFVLPPLVPTAAAHTSADTAPNFEQLLAEAGEKREAGLFSESAALYAQAYRSRPTDVRVDMIGEVTVKNAVADYRRAYEADPGNLELLEAYVQLLDEFLAAREQAYLAGTAPALPEDLAKQLEELRPQLDELRQAQTAANEPEPSPEPEPAPEPEPIVSEPPPPSDDPKHNRKADLAILGVGIASTIGGGVLLGLGGWNLARTSDQAQDELLADIEPSSNYSETQQIRDSQTYRNNINQWATQVRRIGAIHVALGSVLAATGMGLTTWGLVRSIRHKKTSGRHAGRVIPVLTRKEVGLQVTLRW